MLKRSGNWFEVSTEGLRELQNGKPKHYVARELITNAWDEDSDKCDVRASWADGTAKLIVADNSPEGFVDLTHAFTLFAPTRKRLDPEKRGRFNLGEKQALAICDMAKIMTTTGTVIFNKDGRTKTDNKTRAGSVVEVNFKCTKAEFDELISTVRSYLPPEGLSYIVNGEPVNYVKPFRTVNADLPTVVQIDNAFRPSHRKTDISILPCEGHGILYEMGIPVCDIDCDYSLDIQQKVPLTPDRESVTEAYLGKLFAVLFNAIHDQLPEGSAARSWVRIAMEHPSVKPEAVKAWIKNIYGDKVVIANPRDKNSIDEAISKGYRVVYGQELSKATWKNIKAADEAAGGSLMPSTSELFGSQVAERSDSVPETKDMLVVAALVKKIAMRCLRIDVDVRFRSWTGSVAAQYGNQTLTFNVGHLGKGWFQPAVSSKVLDLVIHELSHQEGNHTEHGYHDAMTRIAGELIIIALQEPKFFEISAKELE